ncbi:hypothetical protein Mapa_011944 [Marchantia paleacea]|nr:hypothetical protein Mapa_011944 [Marchantia paleacea]
MDTARDLADAILAGRCDIVDSQLTSGDIIPWQHRHAAAVFAAMVYQVLEPGLDFTTTEAISGVLEECTLSLADSSHLVAGDLIAIVVVPVVGHLVAHHAEELGQAVILTARSGAANSRK